ncbi:MAG TPA: DUF1015 domain-containing protein [Solirubrobacterales bacterium]|nr:DUF1015 domain-containing protein [Solirubrobacterales bacterium]
MAEVRPLRALHYDPDRVPIEAVTAPPYDVIDPDQRSELLARSPHNVVALDLPEADGAGDRYEHAAELLGSWLADGVLVADGGPTIWAYEQDYEAPGGERRTRRGFLARIGVTDYGPGLIRPHERTQPGPKEDRLRLTRATGHNLSPIFVLHSGDAWSLLEPALAAEPFCAVTDPDGTVHRAWPVADPEVHAAVAGTLAGSELLIADGHHRYETARTYADEVGAAPGDDARYTLACLVSLTDSGLSVVATHRLLHGLDEDKQRALREALMAHFEIEAIDEPEDLVPAAGDGTIAFGYMDSFHLTPYRLRLRDEDALAAALPDASEAYRTLDAAALEALILRGPLGMSTDDIAAKRGLSYCSDFEEAVARVDRGDADAGFFLRPTPVEQVRAVADAGETMPPKSTYFFPKLLTGIVFNPLAGGG